MDSITHIALGACMGEAFAGKKLGKKAMLWGVLAQSIPDIDFLASLWMDTSSNLLAHRGFTHSLSFCVIITLLLSYFAERWHRPHNISIGRWVAFFGSAIFFHLFIDAFNNYGVGWLEPFSHQRISFNIVYVADPFLSFVPGIALAALIMSNRYNSNRKKWWQLGLGYVAMYLAYCCVNKSIINNSVQSALVHQSINYTRYFTTPAPLQNWLWYVVAGNDTGYYVGYVSVFDKKEMIDFSYFPVNDSLLSNMAEYKEVQQLKRFSQHFYTVEKSKDTIVFNDLRFGQIIGWQNPSEQFVFHYYLQKPGTNKLVVQRGRFAKWNWEVLKTMVKRIKGD